MILREIYKGAPGSKKVKAGIVGGLALTFGTFVGGIALDHPVHSSDADNQATAISGLVIDAHLPTAQATAAQATVDFQYHTAKTAEAGAIATVARAALGANKFACEVDPVKAPGATDSDRSGGWSDLENLYARFSAIIGGTDFPKGHKLVSRDDNGKALNVLACDEPKPGEDMNPGCHVNDKNHDDRCTYDYPNGTATSATPTSTETPTSTGTITPDLTKTATNAPSNTPTSTGTITPDLTRTATKTMTPAATATCPPCAASPTPDNRTPSPTATPAGMCTAPTPPTPENTATRPAATSTESTPIASPTCDDKGYPRPCPTRQTSTPDATDKAQTPGTPEPTDTSEITDTPSATPTKPVTVQIHADGPKWRLAESGVMAINNPGLNGAEIQGWKYAPDDLNPFAPAGTGQRGVPTGPNLVEKFSVQDTVDLSIVPSYHEANPAVTCDGNSFPLDANVRNLFGVSAAQLLDKIDEVGPACIDFIHETDPNKAEAVRIRANGPEWQGAPNGVFFFNNRSDHPLFGSKIADPNINPFTTAGDINDGLNIGPNMAEKVDLYPGDLNNLSPRTASVCVGSAPDLTLDQGFLDVVRVRLERFLDKLDVVGPRNNARCAKVEYKP